MLPTSPTRSNTVHHIHRDQRILHEVSWNGPFSVLAGMNVEGDESLSCEILPKSLGFERVCVPSDLRQQA
jgi:hypothetical protein